MRSLVIVLAGVVVRTALAPLPHNRASAAAEPATAKAVVSNNARGEEYD